MKQTFKGGIWRVQLRVFDYSDSEYFKDKPTTFSVTLLPADSHKSTAFGGPGHVMYHGPDMVVARGLVIKYLKRVPDLRKWNKYLPTEFQTEPVAI